MKPEGSLQQSQCPPPVPILSQLEPVHTPTSYFIKTHLNIILPSMPGSPKWSLSLMFLHQNPVYAYPLTPTRYMPRPSYYSRFYHPNNIGWAVQIIKLLIVYFSPLPSYLVPFRLQYSLICLILASGILKRNGRSEPFAMVVWWSKQNAWSALDTSRTQQLCTTATPRYSKAKN